MTAEQMRQRLLMAASQDVHSLLESYETSYDGYDEDRAKQMREYYGENKISHQKGDTLLKRVFDAFVNPFTVVLFVIAAISLVTDVLLTQAPKADYTAFIIILSMVMISGLMRFTQEERSNHAAEKLSEMVETTIAVKRAEIGKVEIPIDEVVVGDIIYLAAGDMVPADVRILQAKDLFISQSSLTGESEPLEKICSAISDPVLNPLELDNLAFMGSNVISGSALAIVINVGDYTIFGSLAHQLSGEKVITSFEKGVNSVSWILIRFMLVMVPVVLLINGFTKGDWLQALLFAISVAVGLTPEMLPVIVSANLAKGAFAMSKKQVIVKHLNAIQNFGAMNVLCTDKTGTLTQDRVTLMYSLDIHGNEDERVLRHAFLNSYYQTGLKNLMDIAIIKYSEERQLVADWQGYCKVDEIPFDFNRRRMSVVVANGKTQLITKGAVEEMLSICTYAEYRNQVEPMTEEIKQEIIAKAADYNNRGMRVLGIAQKSNPAPIGAFSVADESDMVFMGYLAFLDPPKESAALAIRALSHFGVAVKILTGDNDAVTCSVCRQVGIKVDNLLLGNQIEQMDENELSLAVEETNVYAKLSPQQKARIVAALRSNSHTVGFMGDGINDAAAMRVSDVGISVDTAVDIAKESANIILLEKDLMVLERGVVEGRKIYANIIKYIKMTASSNFGNMFSVLAASAFLPFLPMLPIHILLLNLIYDISCATIPWDNVDAAYLKKPRQWDPSSISKFMLWIGPTSSVFDVTTYILLYFFICPLACGGAFPALSQPAQAAFIGLFHAGWFVESMWSQTLVIHMIRTPKIPFVQSHASWQLTALTTLGIALGTLIPYTAIGAALNFTPMPAVFFPCLIVTILLYMALVQVLKTFYVRHNGELLA
ncbi:MAG: magnesium-translocating P-type ATPase [Firmicutes bacterium]|nr:magnesium-translocating P-type ATPase [Bacillota bacterium]